jgi:hypothetical protein
MRPADEDERDMELHFTDKAAPLQRVILIACPVIAIWLLCRASPVMPLRPADPMNSIH